MKKIERYVWALLIISSVLLGGKYFYLNKNTSVAVIPEYGIEINFFDWYSQWIDQNQEKYFLFWPNYKDKEKMFMKYDFRFNEVKSKDQIMEDAKQSETLTYWPVYEKINNFDTVSWWDGGMCDYRTMVVFWGNVNYYLTSIWCWTDREYDFEYFKKIVSNIKKMNKK